MFAVIEFISNEIAVVPLKWVYKRETKCRWPLTTGKKTFNDFVKCKPPSKSSWPSYKIIKIHCKIDNFDKAEQELTELLKDCQAEAEETGSSSRSLTRKSNPHYLSDESSEDDSISSFEDTQDTHFLNVSTGSAGNAQGSNITTVEMSASSSTLGISKAASTYSGGVSTLNQTTALEASTSSSTCCLNASTIFPGVSSSSKTLTVEASNSSSSTLGISEASTVTIYSENFESTVLSTLSKIVSNVDQHSIILNEIYRKCTTSENSITQPEDIPSLPLKDLEDFAAFEDKLKSPALYQYMVLRLAAVGGSGIESQCRRIMQYLMTNSLAMKFNWKGKEKIAFQKTKTMTLIYESAKRTFPEKEKSDYLIEKTIKEWLKYSKQRLKSKKIQTTE
ncbi:uncharacterized protein LOC123005230 [Tribolium madens]|uniref:uncharacterized protein LOC123005230 n=1 Tax=Tribolium madens TaxID=41895 RepID=UPI001CF75BD5|nr:uncharacterized protein LOC123005230 [Tribolium madens]